MIVEGIYFVFRVAVLLKKKSFLLISHSSTRNTRICVRISPSTRACFFTFWISMMSYSQLPAVLCLIAPRKPLEPLCTCASISPLPPGHILFAFQHISFPLAKGLIALKKRSKGPNCKVCFSSELSPGVLLYRTNRRGW